MRETMDCGVLLTPGHEITMGHWVARDQPRLARVRLHLVPLRAPGGAPDGPDVHALAGLAVGLRRYDHCILPVAPASLAWTRMSLQQAAGALATPILLFVHDMTAPAIEDLLRLGASDFLAAPYCLESLRVRLGRLARRAPLLAEGLREPEAAYAAGGARHPASLAAAGHRYHGRCCSRGWPGCATSPAATRRRPSGWPRRGWSMGSSPITSAWRCRVIMATWRAPRAPPASTGGHSGR